MNNETRLKRMAAMFNMEIPEGYVPPATNQIKHQKDSASREAEAVLAYVDDSRKFIQRECSSCGGVFAVNRACVGYCGDGCRIRSLEKVGIIWDPSKSPDERWEFKEPLTVPPLVLPHLQETANQRVVDLLELERQQSLIPEIPVPTSTDLENMLADLGID